MLTANQRQLIFRPRLGQKIVEPRFARNRRRRQRVIAGDHHRADAHGAQMLEALAHPAFDDILQVHDTENAAVFGDQQRSSTRIRYPFDRFLNFRWNRPTGVPHILDDCVRRALADFASVHVHARHPRGRGEGNERRRRSRQLSSAQTIFLFGQHHDRTPFRRFIRQRRELRRVGHFRIGHTRRRNKFRRVPVAQRDRSGFVQKQGIHVARRFHRAPGHGQHVLLQHPIHSRDANRGEQSANRRRDQADQQSHQHKHRLWRAGINRHGLQRSHRQQKNNRQPGQ